MLVRGSVVLGRASANIANPTVSDHDTQSERESHTDATEAHDEGEAVIRKFNDAIRKMPKLMQHLPHLHSPMAKTL